MTDINLFWTIVGSAGAIIACIFAFFQGLKNDLRNFKTDIKDDINAHIDLLDRKMGSMNQRMDTFESKIISLEERIFWMATGKKLEDAILEERMKRPRTDP